MRGTIGLSGMSKHNTPAKSCTLRVIGTTGYGTNIREVTDRYNQPIRFRSVRAARRGILWAAREMNALTGRSTRSRS